MADANAGKIFASLSFPFPKGTRMKWACSFVVLIIGLSAAASLWAQGADNGDIALPSGTQLVVTLTMTLSTKGSEEGDPWTGKVEEPIFAEGQEIVPAQSKVAQAKTLPFNWRLWRTSGVLEPVGLCRKRSLRGVAS